MKFLITCATLAIGFAMTSPLQAEEPKLYSIPLKDIDGKPTTLKAYSGKALLIVNVASQCGNTPQYSKLEAVSEKYKEKGLVVLGFPCNDFGQQEPGTNAEIKEFCTSKYAVTFPIFDKLHVKGAEQHPLYSELTGATAPFPGPVKWNFGKFLIGRDGKILKRFEPGIQPDSAEVTAAIDSALAGK
ncbi:MAG: glutathione peroxidase [Chthoniobacteraceae bacterium]|nr:glutathione peroxidase [Chthoniobacteraceae bacterium]